jgi:hypothetical protein
MPYFDLTHREYAEKFASQEACLQHIFDTRWPRGFICPKCEHNDGYRRGDGRRIECCVCGAEQSITAGTIFEKSKTPLPIWFLIIYEIAHDKGGASVLRLSKRLGMHYDTVWNLVAKIRKAMGDRDESLTLAGYIELDEAFFGGRSRKKPGKSATANKKAVVVMVESEGRQAGNVVMKVVPSVFYDDLKPVLAEKVESEPGGQWFRSDGWGSHHVVIAVGHHIKMTPIPEAQLDDVMRCVSLAISHAKRFFKGTYHHFCKIHIQRYLDEFCYRWNRRHLEKQLATHLIAACALSSPITCANLVA